MSIQNDDVILITVFKPKISRRFFFCLNCSSSFFQLLYCFHFLDFISFLTLWLISNNSNLLCPETINWNSEQRWIKLMYFINTYVHIKVYYSLNSLTFTYFRIIFNFLYLISVITQNSSYFFLYRSSQTRCEKVTLNLI